jgi:hypothetical protein
MSKNSSETGSFDSGSRSKTMIARKVPSDQEVLFSIELLTIPLVATNVPGLR